MPTNFTVVPVKDGAKKGAQGAEEEEEEDLVLPEVHQDAAGERLQFSMTSSGDHGFLLHHPTSVLQEAGFITSFITSFIHF